MHTLFVKKKTQTKNHCHINFFYEIITFGMIEKIKSINK